MRSSLRRWLTRPSSAPLAVAAAATEPGRRFSRIAITRSVDVEPVLGVALRRHMRYRRREKIDPQLATSTSLVKAGPPPAFVLARVFAADGTGVAAYVRKQSRAASVTARRSLSPCDRSSRPADQRVAAPANRSTAAEPERRPLLR
jgi:hypothetical protein